MENIFLTLFLTVILLFDKTRMDPTFWK